MEFLPSSADKDGFRTLYFSYAKELSAYDSSIDTEDCAWFSEQYENNDRLAKFFVFDKGKIVGFVVLQFVDERDNVSQPLWYIAEFFIRPEYRRQHYGTEAVRHLLATRRGDVFLYILKKNSPALDFWEKVAQKLNLQTVSRPELFIDDAGIIKCFANS